MESKEYYTFEEISTMAGSMGLNKSRRTLEAYSQAGILPTPVSVNEKDLRRVYYPADTKYYLTAIKIAKDMRLRSNRLKEFVLWQVKREIESDNVYLTRKQLVEKLNKLAFDLAHAVLKKDKHRQDTLAHRILLVKHYLEKSKGPQRELF